MILHMLDGGRGELLLWDRERGGGVGVVSGARARSAQRIHTLYISMFLGRIAHTAQHKYMCTNNNNNK